MLMRVTFVLFAVFACLSSFAQGYSMTPSSGPSTGGTEVTITGDFDATPRGVMFGGTGTEEFRLENAHTIVAVTPEHLPGPAKVEILEGFQSTPTGLTFTFTGEVPASYERLLLPIFLDPVRGQFGSEFVTSFTAQLQQGELARMHGLTFACRFICPPGEFAGTPLGVVPAFPRLEGDSLVHDGNPGRFIYVTKDELPNVAMSLRVYDRSRTTQSFGTELPIVHENQFTHGTTVITLLNVPTDARFRNALRIYATAPTQVMVRVSATITEIYQPVTLSGGGSVFEPATATFTAFPPGLGLATVTITVPPEAHVWAFVSVTNNDTQQITTVSPQP